MLCIAKPRIIKCERCGEEKESNNKIGVCRACYKFLFTIEEKIPERKKVDWSRMKAGGSRCSGSISDKG